MKSAAGTISPDLAKISSMTMMLVLTGPCLGKEQKTVGYLPVSDAIEEIFLGARRATSLGVAQSGSHELSAGRRWIRTIGPCREGAGLYCGR